MIAFVLNNYTASNKVINNNRAGFMRMVVASGSLGDRFHGVGE